MPDSRLGIGLVVNGRRHELEVAADHTLLDVLRERLGLTGTKECCAEGECGACTVLVDGHAVNSCLVLAVEADEREVTTIEGLANHRLSPVQEAFLEAGGVQCGFCIPGMVMAAHYLLQQNADPSPDEIREGLSGNLCRCGGYNQICEAVAAAARRWVTQGVGR
ncbi:MAG TPA: (2Fe-2S)-binding protein [Candidatus Limnocylindria bacterium]|nr:(2Fe-2S)-binding protein [Candidatus Limnocylindria bacterium]